MSKRSRVFNSMNLKSGLKNNRLDITFDNAVIDEIAELGYVPELGARPLKRAIQQSIIVPVSQYILKIQRRKKCHVSFDKDQGIDLS